MAKLFYESGEEIQEGDIVRRRTDRMISYKGERAIVKEVNSCDVLLEFDTHYTGISYPNAKPGYGWMATIDTLILISRAEPEPDFEITPAELDALLS